MASIASKLEYAQTHANTQTRELKNTTGMGGGGAGMVLGVSTQSIWLDLFSRV